MGMHTNERESIIERTKNDKYMYWINMRCSNIDYMFGCRFPSSSWSSSSSSERLFIIPCMDSACHSIKRILLNERTTLPNNVFVISFFFTVSFSLSLSVPLSFSSLYFELCWMWWAHTHLRPFLFFLIIFHCLIIFLVPCVVLLEPNTVQPKPNVWDFFFNFFLFAVSICVLRQWTSNDEFKCKVIIHPFRLQSKDWFS